MNGVGINTANVRTGILDVAGIATFRSNTLVGSGITLSPDGDVFTTGITTIGKRILGISTNNIIPFLYNNYSDLPSASTYHGAFVHVHVAGKAFYAHAGAWYQLVNVGSELTVGLGTEKYNVGILTASTIKVGSGVTLSSDGDAFVTGISTATKFVGDLSDAVTSRWAVVNDSSNHYQFTGPGGLSSSNDPTIYLARGQTYEFNVNASGHPFHIQTSSGAYNSSNLYTTGVTNPGAAVGVIKFAVPFSAPNTLYYVCQNHSAMAGTIVVYPSI
jgi:plastocyanin